MDYKKKKIALFALRCQPPHIGHIMTAMKLYPLYDKIILAISENTYGGTKKPIISTKEVQRILTIIFGNFPKFEIIVMGKGLSERTRFDDLPHFDVVVTANGLVVDNLKKYGIKVVYQYRSKVGKFNISGDILREKLHGCYD